MMEVILLEEHFKATPSSYDDNLLIKIDGDGNEIWTQTYGGGFDEGTCQLTSLSNGHYLMSGRLGVGDDTFIANLRMINDDGNIVWEKQYGDANSHSGFVSSVEDWDNNVVVVGETIDSAGWRVGTMLKVNLNGDSLWMREYRLFETNAVHFLLDIGIG